MGLALSDLSMGKSLLLLVLGSFIPHLLNNEVADNTKRLVIPIVQARSRGIDAQLQQTVPLSKASVDHSVARPRSQ